MDIELLQQGGHVGEHFPLKTRAELPCAGLCCHELALMMHSSYGESTESCGDSFRKNDAICGITCSGQLLCDPDQDM